MQSGRTVAELLRARARDAPEEPFVKCGGGWLSRAELDAVSDRVAAGLRALGVQKGDRVAIFSANRQEIVELHMGCAKLGAIQVPLNCFLKGEMLRHQLSDSGASVLVADAAGLRAAQRVIEGTAVKTVILLDEDPAADARPYDELRTADGGLVATALSATDPVSILYTSGTTGPAKGCVLSNGYYVAIGRALGEAGLVRPGDRVFTAWPMFHLSGHVLALLPALANHASVCYAMTFSASSFISTARAEGATAIFGVGPMAMAILAQPRHPADGDSGLRVAVFTPVPPEAQLEFEERFNTSFLAEVYGQTECFPISLSRLDGPRNRATAGRPLPHLEVKIVDDDNEAVPPGVTGEIVVRAVEPNVMFAGYWNGTTPHDGAGMDWHHTGDNGQIDEDGFLSFVDRKKDSLRRRGENVSSFELEAAIVQHPGVAEVAVVATPSELGEDDIRVCLVPVEGVSLDAEELFEFFRRELPYFAIPRYAEVREQLPRTVATGRVMKHVLRDEGVQADAWDFQALGFAVAHDERRA
jgi:carnitine-CoA ligase